MDGMGSLMFHFVVYVWGSRYLGNFWGSFDHKIYGQERARFICYVLFFMQICWSSDDTWKVGIKSVVSKDVSFFPENDWNDPIWLISRVQLDWNHIENNWMPRIFFIEFNYTPEN